jgi:HD superfamily phosphohydrolase YqeK
MFKKRAILLLKMKKVDQEIINAIKEHTVWKHSMTT